MPATSRYARGVSPAVKVTVYGWENLDVGQKEAKTIAWGSPLKLRLATHQTSATANGYGEFGTARVLCTK